jgi:AcrR family transcriptional regulator
VSTDDVTRPTDARARAAKTKRDRTRRALLDAADSVFGSRGWTNVRMEDVATAAGVSAATAYNHFPSKHALVGHVFAPIVRPLEKAARQDIDAGRPVDAAVKDQVVALVRVSKRNQILTSSYWSAVDEYALRSGARAVPGDENDPRNLAPVPDALLVLVEHGQRTGVFRAYPPAEEMAALVVSLLLARSHYHPDETAAELAELLLTVLFGSIKPELLTSTRDAGRPFRNVD